MKRDIIKLVSLLLTAIFALLFIFSESNFGIYFIAFIISLIVYMETSYE